MRDDVVQLARDPRLLLGRRPARLGFALPLEPLGLLLDLAHVRAARADAVAEQPGCDEEDDAGGLVAELDQPGAERDRHPRDRASTPSPRAHGCPRVAASLGVAADEQHGGDRDRGSAV